MKAMEIDIVEMVPDDVLDEAARMELEGCGRPLAHVSGGLVLFDIYSNPPSRGLFKFRFLERFRNALHTILH